MKARASVADVLIRTARLDLIASTIEHLDAELSSFDTLADLLGVVVPGTWPPGLYDADAMRFFRGRLAAEGSDAVGWYGWYAVYRNPRTLVASGGYMGPPVNGAVEIGYSVVADWRGRGVATEMISALAERALGVPHVTRVVARVDRGNVPSHRALLRAGFHEVIGAEQRGEDLQALLEFCRVSRSDSGAHAE